MFHQEASVETIKLIQILWPSQLPQFMLTVNVVNKTLYNQRSRYYMIVHYYVINLKKTTIIFSQGRQSTNEDTFATPMSP